MKKLLVPALVTAGAALVAVLGWRAWQRYRAEQDPTARTPSLGVDQALGAPTTAALSRAASVVNILDARRAMMTRRGLGDA